VDAHGVVWVSGNGEQEDVLLMYDGVQWTTLPPHYTDIRFIRLDPENRVWIVGQMGQIFTFDPQTDDWTPQLKEAELNYRIVKDIQFDHQDHLWAATDYGLYVYDGSTLTGYHMYSADLYSEMVSGIIVIGNGPALVTPVLKPAGTVHGKLVNPNPTVYANMQVEICLISIYSDSFWGILHAPTKLIMH
jgi:hypothetical protein